MGRSRTKPHHLCSQGDITDGRFAQCDARRAPFVLKSRRSGSDPYRSCRLDRLGTRRPQALKVATFQADVTPPIGAPLCHGNVPPVASIAEPLTARGLVLCPGDQQPIVLCSVDFVNIGNASNDLWRESLAGAVGTSPSRVTVHTLHQHTAPGVDASTEALLAGHNLSGALFDVGAEKAARDATAQAAAAAVRSGLDAVTHIGTGKGRVEEFASNRRILGPDGKVQYTRGSSCQDPKIRAFPEGTVDPFVRAIAFFADDRPLAILSYYATHPQSYYRDGIVSYDTVGVARAIREQALPGAAILHFNGAGGDIAAGKYNDGSHENRKILGQRLAEGMRLAWEDMRKTPIHAADVQWKTVAAALPVRTTIQEQTTRALLADPAQPQRDRVFAARELAFLQRMQSAPLLLGCLHLGSAKIVHMPGELCIGYQLAAYDMAPSDFVCLAAYGDTGPGYIPLAEQFPQGGYEAHLRLPRRPQRGRGTHAGHARHADTVNSSGARCQVSEGGGQRTEGRAGRTDRG